jgi:hypothetical protein
MNRLSPYPDPLTPKSFPDLLQAADYDPFHLMPRFFPSHPHLLITPRGIRRFRRLIHQPGWHARSFSLLLERTETPLPETPDSPTKADPAWAQTAALAALRNAVAGTLTGRRAFFVRARALLRRLAAWYPALPVSAGLGRLGIEDSQEAQFIVRIAQTYDLLAAEGLALREDRLFRHLLESTRAASESGAQQDCGNHNTAVLRGRLAAAIALHDRQGVHDVLYGWGTSLADWRYGLVHQLRHDVLDDGLHWERAPGYHGYVLFLMAEMADMLDPLGVDLWHKPLPPLWQNDGMDLHRDYGTRLGTKTLKAAFDALVFLAFPSGDLSLLNDSRLVNLRGLFIWGPLLHRAWEAYRDPLYAALIQKSEREIPQDRRPLPGLPLALQSPWISEVEFLKIPRPRYPEQPFRLPRTASFSLAGRHENHATLFPVYGAAVLRAQPATPSAPSAFLFWGPHVAGHQSPAALHLDLHAGGEPVTDAPRMDDRGYADPLYLTWARTTIAHNTVTVDGTPMFPYDFETHSIWECDRWRDSISNGERLLFQPDGRGFQAVRALNERVYSGVCLDRTVIVSEGLVLDLFRILSHRRHRYDWAMHVVGTPDHLPSGRSARLGQRRGYRHFSEVRRLPGRESLLTLVWKRARGYTQLGLLAPKGAAVYLARDPLPPAETSHTIGELDPVLPRYTVLARATERKALFLAAWTFGPSPVVLSLRQGGPDTDVIIRTEGPGASSASWFVPFAPEPVRRLSR